METEIPSEVRRSIDGEAARRDVIGPEVPSTSLRKSANEHCASENQHQKNIPNEAVFWFHNDNVTIELGFDQQVAHEARKSFPKHSSAAEVAKVSTSAECFYNGNRISVRRECR
jgi:hypothetical protein